MKREQIKKLVAEMTLEEKAGLTSGADGWFTKAVERLHIPAVRTSDGPVGLRKIIEDDLNNLSGKSEQAVCFPSSCTTTSSFDRELLYELGQTLGKLRRTRTRKSWKQWRRAGFPWKHWILAAKGC